MHIHFGAFAPPLYKQLESQGFEFEWQQQAWMSLQLDADAIVRLCVRGIITDSQAVAARKKLMKKIEQTLKSKIGG